MVTSVVCMCVCVRGRRRAHAEFHLVEFGTVLASLLVPGNSSVSGARQTLQVGAVALGNHHHPLLRLHLQPS